MAEKKYTAPSGADVTEVTRRSMTVRLLELEAQHATIWAERQTIIAKGLRKGLSGMEAERNALAVTDPKLSKVYQAANAEILEAEPQTYEDCRAKLDAALHPHLGLDLEEPGATAVRQVLTFLTRHEGDTAPRHLERIAADLAKVIDRYNAKPHKTETAKGKARFAEICELTDEIIDYPAANASDAAIKAQLLRDQLRCFAYGERQERLLADLVTFLESTGDVAEREVGTLA